MTDIGIPPDHVVHDLVFQQSPQLWHLPHDVWERSIWPRVSGKTVKVAILDTGFSAHPSLPTPLIQRTYIQGESPKDGNGHGTHCSGTAVGRGGLGVAPEATLMVYKVLSNRGSGSNIGILKAIDDAVRDGADILSLSLGGGGLDQRIQSAMKRAWEAGVWVNSAAGNAGYNGSNTIGYPAKGAWSLCNGATRSDGSIANFSSGGRELDWATPGQNIISASHRGSGFVSMSGTSMATPFGSGFLALIKELLLREGRPVWRSPNEFRQFIMANVDDRGAPGKDSRFGYGVPLYRQVIQRLIEDDIKWI